MRQELALFGGAAVVALVCSWSLCARSDHPAANASASPAANAPAAQDAPEAAAPATGQLAPPPAAPATADRSRLLELPDGTSVPTLNGATDAAPLTHYWGTQPWSPIVGVERSEAGLDWYRHADGSYSTTQMVWRSDLGRMAAMTRVAHPGPAPAAAAAPR